MFPNSLIEAPCPGAQQLEFQTGSPKVRFFKKESQAMILGLLHPKGAVGKTPRTAQHGTRSSGTDHRPRPGYSAQSAWQGLRERSARLSKCTHSRHPHRPVCCVHSPFAVRRSPGHVPCSMLRVLAASCPRQWRPMLRRGDLPARIPLLRCVAAVAPQLVLIADSKLRTDGAPVAALLPAHRMGRPLPSWPQSRRHARRSPTGKPRTA